jgi:hypothetical protein
MTYRALFIGGPIDGQERVLQVEVPLRMITVPEYSTQSWTLNHYVTYRLIHDFKTPEDTVLVYSLWDLGTTLLHLWNHYTGGKYAHSV